MIYFANERQSLIISKDRKGCKVRTLCMASEGMLCHILYQNTQWIFCRRRFTVEIFASPLCAMTQQRVTVTFWATHLQQWERHAETKK